MTNQSPVSSEGVSLAFRSARRTRPAPKAPGSAGAPPSLRLWSSPDGASQKCRVGAATVRRTLRNAKERPTKQQGPTAFGVRTLLTVESGADRDRTDDLLHAMQALSQLSYSPIIL